MIEDFSKWFEQTVDDEKPDLVVAIARAALRLVDLADARTKIGTIPFVSDCALPFLSDDALEDKTVLLFDDSVVHGSTMEEILFYLKCRGAKPVCAAYVVDRLNFLGERSTEDEPETNPSKFSDIPVRRKRLYSSEQMRRHHRSIVRALIQTPGNYNPEFLTFHLRASAFRPGDIPYLAAKIGRASDTGEFRNVSTHDAMAAGIYRWVAHLANTRIASLPDHGVHQRPYAKLRVTFVPKSGSISFPPDRQYKPSDPLKWEPRTVGQQPNRARAPERRAPAGGSEVEPGAGRHFDYATVALARHTPFSIGRRPIYRAPPRSCLGSISCLQSAPESVDFHLRLRYDNGAVSASDAKTAVAFLTNLTEEWSQRSDAR